MTDERLRRLLEKCQRFSLVPAGDLQDALVEIGRLQAERDAAVLSTRMLNQKLHDLSEQFRRIFKQ